MTDKTVAFEDVIEQALKLSPIEKVRLVERLVATLETDLVKKEKQPLNTLWGLCADLGTAPSAEEIDEARREVWSNFPREDI
jgi:hypothetical protein